ncbi:UDP-N-acetylmuramate--L-alanine ligase [soil metagenome]
MSEPADYFFVGVGGSGMTPLALIVKGQGSRVEGSDRARDQGRSPDKFARLEAQGVVLHPQDGSGVTRPTQVVVTSAAVEATIPDVEAARRVGAIVRLRADLLAELFNAAPVSVGVAGTSGKSTTTAMIAHILNACGRDPTVMNGAEMKDFDGAAAVIGLGALFVAEVDESDGSIALYRPTVAVVNNLSLDHKSMEELRALFGDFAGRAKTAVLNLDNAEAAALRATLPTGVRVRSFGIDRASADLCATCLRSLPGGAAFEVLSASGERASATLRTPGRHNVSNALAALSACLACDVSLADAVAALATFSGVRRRMDVKGSAAGVTVIDDFAHNPDKLAATLTTLRESPGRLLLMFQPHGYGPLKLMGGEIAAALAEGMSPDDRLWVTEPVYYGGTVDRAVTGADLARMTAERGVAAEGAADREAAAAAMLGEAQPGDRIVVMGARDDTLSDFAADLLVRLGERPA